MRENAVRAGAAEKFIGISRRSQAPFVVQRRLLCKLHARLELVFPFVSHFYDHSRKFMPDNNRIGIDILRRAFMFLPLLYQLIRRHADAVAHYLYEDFIVLDRRKLELLQP